MKPYVAARVIFLTCLFLFVGSLTGALVMPHNPEFHFWAWGVAVPSFLVTFILLVNRHSGLW